MSKAISPEFRGIFEKIEHQAEEYSKAFDELNKLQRDLKRIQRENKELFSKNDELFQKNFALCERLENIETYIDKRMAESVQEVIKYFEKTILEKTDSAIKNFETHADELIEAVEGTTGLVEIVKKLRNAKTLIDDKIKYLDIEKTAIKNLEKNMAEELQNFKAKSDEITQSMNKMLKKFNQEVAEANETANYKSEAKIKTILSDNQKSQLQLAQKIAANSKKIDSFLLIGKKLEQHIKSVTNSLKQQNKPQNQQIDSSEFMILNEKIENMSISLLERIEKIEKTKNVRK